MAFSVTIPVLRLTVLTAIFGCFFLKAASRAACILSSAAVYTTTSEADWASAPEGRARQAITTRNSMQSHPLVRMGGPPLLMGFPSDFPRNVEYRTRDVEWRRSRPVAHEKRNGY